MTGTSEWTGSHQQGVEGSENSIGLGYPLDIDSLSKYRCSKQLQVDPVSCSSAPRMPLQGCARSMRRGDARFSDVENRAA